MQACEEGGEDIGASADLRVRDGLRGRGCVMSMSWDEMQDGIRNAKSTINLFNRQIDQIAYLLRDGNLRHVQNQWTLLDLKAQLKRYNAVTKTWKE